jgi:hypothetical protein
LFSIAVDVSHTLLLIRFSGLWTPEDFTQLDMLLRPMADVQSVDKVIVDLSGVSRVDVPIEQLIDRATGGPTLAGRKKVFVASSALPLRISKQFAAHRKAAGHGEAPVVQDLEDAYRTLGIDPPSFR